MKRKNIFIALSILLFLFLSIILINVIHFSGNDGKDKKEKVDSDVENGEKLLRKQFPKGEYSIKFVGRSKELLQYTITNLGTKEKSYYIYDVDYGDLKEVKPPKNSVSHPVSTNNNESQ